MAECSKSKVTVVQLFFLSFSYVFSGLFLIREKSFLSILIPLGTVFLFACPGYFFLQCAPRVFAEKERFLLFLSCGKPHWVSKALMSFLILLSAVEILLTWMAFAFSVTSGSSFLAFPFSVLLILLLVLFVSAHGLTAIGRFSELFVFLIVPLLFRTVLRGFESVDFGAFSPDLYAFGTVTPAPILYLFSMTVSASTSMPKPIRRLFIIPLLSFCGALMAVFCAFLFLLFGTEEQNVFFLLFGWTASLIRLSLLVSVCTSGNFSRKALV